MPGCWSCGQEAGAEAFCAACGKLQPARPRDHFEVLGLERRYHLDPAQLDARWRELSRRLHPDRFAQAPARERRFSLEQSTALNQAYKTLREPARRAEYLLRTEGFEVAGDEGARAGEKLPTEFYEEVMEDREALLEAQAEGGEAVSQLAARVEARRAETVAAIERAFSDWERTGNRQALEPAVARLARLRYFARFLDEVEGGAHD